MLPAGLEEQVRGMLSVRHDHGMAQPHAKRKAVRNATLDALAREAYAQDLVCFGYD